MNKKIIFITIFTYFSLLSMDMPVTPDEPVTGFEQVVQPFMQPRSMRTLLSQNPEIINQRMQGSWLDLSGLNINSLEGIEKIPNINAIESLSLNNNPLYRLDKNTLKLLPQLHALNASSIQLNTIAPYTFVDNKKLIILSLNDNPLQKIDRTQLFGLENLEVLNLHNTQLSQIDIDTFAELHKLKILTLNNNRLKELNPRIIRILSSLKTLNIKNNPLDSKAVEALRKEFPKIRIIF